jgi:hypothetical protein
LVTFVHIHAHGNLSGFNNLICPLLVFGDLLNSLFHFISHIFAVSIQKVDQFGVDGVIIHDLGQFGEVPCEPFLEPHAEGIDVFVHLIDKRDRLNNWLVLAVDILGASVARVRVAKTELGSPDVGLIDFYNKWSVTS